MGKSAVSCDNVNKRGKKRHFIYDHKNNQILLANFQLLSCITSLTKPVYRPLLFIRAACQKALGPGCTQFAAATSGDTNDKQGQQWLPFRP